jgi:hypothetical protein
MNNPEPKSMKAELVSLPRSTHSLVLVQKQANFRLMNTCSLSKAKSALGKLADQALKGRPTLIPRGGKLVILQAYEPPAPDEFDELISQGLESEHVAIRNNFWGGVRRRGRKLAKR